MCAVYGGYYRWKTCNGMKNALLQLLVSVGRRETSFRSKRQSVTGVTPLDTVAMSTLTESPTIWRNAPVA